MSFEYKAVYKSFLTGTFSYFFFFADSDKTAREKARESGKFPLQLTSIVCFESGNKTRDIGLTAKQNIAQITINDDYKE